jgi:hypothetical protein
MRLKNVARYFDTCPIYDGYSGAFLFKAQTSTFMESSAEGSVSVRRTISIDPLTSIPNHRVIDVLSEKYVVGEVNYDEWAGGVIRATCWVKKAAGLFSSKTPHEFLSGTVVPGQYGQLRFRNLVKDSSSSNIEPYWEAYFSATSSVAKGSIVTYASKRYRVSSTYTDVDGFLTAEMQELRYGIEFASFDGSKTYDPISDTYTGSSTVVSALPVDCKQLYDIKTQADHNVEVGDIQLLATSGTVASVGTSVEFSSGELKGSWRTLSVGSEIDAVSLHIRRI